MLFLLLLFALMTYVAYRILRHSIPQMQTQVHLNKLVNGNLPVHLGGSQPSYDYNALLTNEFRLREVNQLERVFEYGYRVTHGGEWRG